MDKLFLIDGLMIELPDLQDFLLLIWLEESIIFYISMDVFIKKGKFLKLS